MTDEGGEKPTTWIGETEKCVHLQGNPNLKCEAAMIDELDSYARGVLSECAPLLREWKVPEGWEDRVDLLESNDLFASKFREKRHDLCLQIRKHYKKAGKDVIKELIQLINLSYAINIKQMQAKIDDIEEGLIYIEFLFKLANKMNDQGLLPCIGFCWEPIFGTCHKHAKLEDEIKRIHYPKPQQKIEPHIWEQMMRARRKAEASVKKERAKEDEARGAERWKNRDYDSEMTEYMKCQTRSYLEWYYENELRSRRPMASRDWICSGARDLAKQKIKELGLDLDTGRIWIITKNGQFICYDDPEYNDDMDEDEKKYSLCFEEAMDELYETTYIKWINKPISSTFVESPQAPCETTNVNQPFEITEQNIKHIKQKSRKFAKKYGFDEEELFNVFLNTFGKCIHLYRDDGGAQFATYLNAAFNNACKDLIKRHGIVIKYVLCPTHAFNNAWVSGV